MSVARCEILYRRGELFFEIRRKGHDGISYTVYFAHKITVLPQEIGQAVRDALAASKEATGFTWDPDELRSELKRLYEAARVKSWGELMRGAALVGVDALGSLIRITPSTNAGSRSGFLFVPESEALELEAPTNTELGELVLEGLRRSGAAVG